MFVISLSSISPAAGGGKLSAAEGWASILPHGRSCCVDNNAAFPYQLFNGYDGIEINNSLDFLWEFMV